jgi:hypothetical protein
VANFSLATDESFTDRVGDRQVRTEWHRPGRGWPRYAVIISPKASKSISKAASAAASGRTVRGTSARAEKWGTWLRQI